MRVVVLAGGVGAARFLQGVVQVVPPSQVTAIVNTGDDAEFYGLHISPDLDTVMYTLAGLVNPETGWGLLDDTTACLESLGRLGADTWFRLGDRDLATHLHRTALLRAGGTLSAVTRTLCEALGVAVQVLPMSDESVRTHVETPRGLLPFQEYFVRRGQQDDVLGVTFVGIDAAQPAPGVLDALTQADAILIAPSNPFVSVAPILALPGVRDVLVARAEVVAAVSPIVGGAAVKGPAGRMLLNLGHEVSALGVARLYEGVARVFVLDEVDESLAPPIAALGMRAVLTATLMVDAPAKRALAAAALDALSH